MSMRPPTVVREGGMEDQVRRPLEKPEEACTEILEIPEPQGLEVGMEVAGWSVPVGKAVA